MTTPLHSKVLIIGSGPAGLTAAIYSARANLQPLVIEGEPSSTSDQPGGQLMLTTEVENFPGFPEGIMGPELMMRCRDQAIRFGTEFITEKVTKVDFSSKPFRAWVRDTEYTADALIVSTGAQSLMLGLEEEKRLIGHGLSTCATCDGFFFRGQEIVVVGGGDSALEEAQFLTKFASKVTIVHRRESLRASKIMQQRVLEHPKVKPAWDSVVAAIAGDAQGNVAGVKLRNLKTGAVTDVSCKGIFVAIGHQPNTKPFAGAVRTDEAGYIVPETGSQVRTGIAGVFVAGDCADHVYRQAITAAGMGCQAAIETERWLAEHGG